jgi:hypothetical protein
MSGCQHLFYIVACSGKLTKAASDKMFFLLEDAEKEANRLRESCPAEWKVYKCLATIDLQPTALNEVTKKDRPQFEPKDGCKGHWLEKTHFYLPNCRHCKPKENQNEPHQEEK